MYKEKPLTMLWAVLLLNDKVKQKNIEIQVSESYRKYALIIENEKKVIAAIYILKYNKNDVIYV